MRTSDKRWPKRLMFLVLSVFFAFSVLALPAHAYADDDIVDSGEGWRFSSDGTLTIDGAVPAWEDGIYSKVYDDWYSEDNTPRPCVPWHDYRTRIKSVIALDGASVSTCRGMFYECYSLESVDLAHLDTSRVTDMSGMFSDCSSLTSLDLSGLDTSGVTNMDAMFNDCRRLVTLDASSWDTTHVESMGTDYSFYFDGPTIPGMFSECLSLASLDVSGWDVSSVTDMAFMFLNCSSLPFLDVSSWNTSKVKDMDGMFMGCSLLASLDVSGWDTPSVTDTGRMFYGCSSLAALDVSGWDTSQLVSMGGNDPFEFEYKLPAGMFCGCSSLAALDVSGWDTSKVKTMRGVFCGCSSLSTLDVSGWDTSQVTDMVSMFSGCSSLAALDLSGWDVSQVEYMGGAFSGCSSLAALDLSGWDATQVHGIMYLFSGCSSLTCLDLSGWDTTQVNGHEGDSAMWGMFFDCTSLSRISIGEKFDFLHSSEGDFPNPLCDDELRWTSELTGETFTGEEIRLSRGCIADTYYYEAPTSIEDAKVSAIGDQSYTGSEICPIPTVTVKGKTLVNGTDFTLFYEDNVGIGIATVTITGVGAYAGEASATFRIRASWAGGAKLPVNATAAYTVPDGAWIRLKDAKGNFVTENSVTKLSAPSTTSKVVTAKKAGTTTLYLRDSFGTVASRKITVYSITGANYELQSALDKSLVLDIQGKSKNNSARMLVYTRNNGKNQRFRFEAKSDGTYMIRCVHSGKYVDVQGGGTEKSQAVIQYTKNSKDNQRWRISVDASNRITFTCKKSGMCFDIQGGKAKKGAKMIQYPSNGGKNQKWVLNKK